MPVEHETRRFETARELVDYLLHEAPTDAIYRGESDATWDLRPSAWRESFTQNHAVLVDAMMGASWTDEYGFDRAATPESLALRYCGDQSDQSLDRIKALTIQLTRERRVIDRFAQWCDRVGLALPANDRSQLHVRIASTDAIWPRPAEEGGPFPREVPSFAVTTFFAMAQHLGLPTRIVDFSDNPLKAAFFSLAGPTPLLMALGGNMPDTSIWVLEPAPLDSIRERVRMGDDAMEFRVLRSHVPYLHAQDGLFLVCNVSANRYFLQHGSWPQLLDVMHAWRATRLLLPHGESIPLSAILARMGIDRLSMWPSFEKVAAHVKSFQF